MSSYLLLRNNKESGPFTMDEVKSMSLKTYDLIWVVGKSAAWRYPGEIPELKSFAPSVPEQEADIFRKRTNTESQGSDFSNPQIPDSHNSQRPAVNSQRSVTNRSVYINLPAEKKSGGKQLSDLILEESGMITSDTSQSEYDFTEIYKSKPSAAARYSGKILWISTIMLLFGAGIMTGFFISDRRKFFSSDENHPQNNPATQQVVFKDKKENSAGALDNNPAISNDEITSFNPDSLKKTNRIPKKINGGAVKKVITINAVNKDSMQAEQAVLAAIRVKDSLKQDAINKSEMLYQRIKANPEKYLNLSTGRYSTGLFGGISSFPITVTNNSPVKIEMVEVIIDYIQNNEKVFKTETLSFNDLEPGEDLTLKAPKSTRGTKIATHIHIINMHQPDPGSSN
jgi:uncharacterized protein YneF (UPF0154 family)